MVPQSADYPRAYQANALVRAPLKLSNVEARLFALALGCIHQGQTELPGISIPMSKVLRQKKGGSVYETIREACKGLMTKIVSIEAKNKSKNRFTAYSIISFMDINEGTGLITGNFAPEIKPFLLQLAEHYTHVEIEILLLLRSAHAHRLFWLLKSWDDVGVWEVDFEVLRKQMLGDDNEITYTIFHDFKRYVLEPSLREIHALGWLVSYVALKEGKKVRAIRFSIPEAKQDGLLADSPSSVRTIKGEREARDSQPVPDKQMTLNLSADSPTVQQRVVTRLQKLKLTVAQIQHILQYLGDDEPKLAKLMKVTHPLLRDFEAGNKVFENLGGATLNQLKTEFPGLYQTLK
jgi:plasmid replication initiation protein